jgi:hypothetical protein
VGGKCAWGKTSCALPAAHLPLPGSTPPRSAAGSLPPAWAWAAAAAAATATDSFAQAACGWCAVGTSLAREAPTPSRRRWCTGADQAARRTPSPRRPRKSPPRRRPPPPLPPTATSRGRPLGPPCRRRRWCETASELAGARPRRTGLRRRAWRCPWEAALARSRRRCTAIKKLRIVR